LSRAHRPCIHVQMLGSSDVITFLATTDYARTRTFLVDVLGLRLVAETPFAHVYDANGTVLRVSKVDAFTPHPFTVLGWNVTDVAGKVAALTRAGVVFERFGFLAQDDHGVWTSPDGAKVCWFKDPDGNLLSMTEWPAA